ncbi:MAG: metallophosphoesterase family protein [Lutibacter sp.]
MKILIFGDVHGNLPALELLLKKEHNNYDKIICHGDVVNYGPWSNECVELLETLPNSTFLKGNHEENFLIGNYTGKHPVANAFFDFCYPKFDKSLLEIIKDYAIKTEQGNFIIQHTINNQYVFANTDISAVEINNNYIIGHSHQQFEINKNNFKIYNTGSLGQNREFINQSCYLKLDTETNKVELKFFIFDVDMVINQMKVEKYPIICTDYYLSKKRL